jgi:DNA modification methylase
VNTAAAAANLASAGRILTGDCRTRLAELPDGSVDCCVTSPPYWGLRDYGVAAQIGLEPSPGAYVERMAAVFRHVRRVLASDGSLWLNLGDCYATGAGRVGVRPGGGARGDRWAGPRQQPNRLPQQGLKPKDLVGLPWRVAFALQADGWFLRSDVIWEKPNAMPEPVRDRPTRSHEYLFLLTKSPRYHFDAQAIREPARSTHPSGNGYRRPERLSYRDRGGAARGNERPWQVQPLRNRRTVWSVCTRPYRGAHFATFPPALVEPCILASCRPGGTVLDPFGGTGTVGEVAWRLGRRFVLVELNPDYVALAEKRLAAAEARDAPC